MAFFLYICMYMIDPIVCFVCALCYVVKALGAMPPIYIGERNPRSILTPLSLLWLQTAVGGQGLLTKNKYIIFMLVRKMFLLAFSYFKLLTWIFLKIVKLDYVLQIFYFKIKKKRSSTFTCAPTNQQALPLFSLSTSLSLHIFPQTS